jgi:hypothetical protein
MATRSSARKPATCLLACLVAGLTTEPRHLLGALDSATELLGSAG